MIEGRETTVLRGLQSAVWDIVVEALAERVGSVALSWGELTMVGTRLGREEMVLQLGVSYGTESRRSAAVCSVGLPGKAMKNWKSFGE